MTTKLPLTENEKQQREINRVASQNARFDMESKEDMPEGFTIGYIGNCSSEIDDRSWVIFRAHPGRIGTKEDRVGGYSTQERYKLRPLINAIKFAHNLV